MMTILKIDDDDLNSASAIGGGAGVQGPGVGRAEEGAERAGAQDPTVAGKVSCFELDLLQPPELEACQPLSLTFHIDFTF